MNEHSPTAAATKPTAPPATPRPGLLHTVWKELLAAFGTLLGLAPHVLHHVGLLAGAALIAGAGGTALLAIVGLAAAVPFLLRLRRRFYNWWAPAVALAGFALMFSISAFVIGPAINANDSLPVHRTPTTEFSGHNWSRPS